MNHAGENKLGRRELLARAGKAGLSIAAAGTVSYLLYDAAGPQNKVGKSVSLPDFSVGPIKGQTISVIKGSDRVESVGKAIKLLGGIERFVRPGETVVIKPNIAFASPSALCATSNPELVAEIVRLCYKGKAKRVYVTDNPINDPASCFRLSGIGGAASEAGAKIILPRAGYFSNTTLTGGRLIDNWPVLFEPLEKADKLIGVAVIKDHHRSKASMTMKNWYGLLGGRRNIFHQNINTIIAELAMLMKPTLVILDGTEVMKSNGPTGGSITDLKRENTMIASCDMVAADSYGCGLLGLKPKDLPYLGKAEKAVAGTTDYHRLKPIFDTAG